MSRRAGLFDAPLLAALHATSFPEPWDAEAFTILLAQPGVAGWIWGDPPRGLLLARAVADEAEILTVAVTPEARQQGGGRQMIEDAVAALKQGGTGRLFLEVAADNTAALALYRSRGFAPCGRRPGYYAGGATDAVIMERAL